jgi:hypothetical protein
MIGQTSSRVVFAGGGGAYVYTNGVKRRNEGKKPKQFIPHIQLHASEMIFCSGNLCA